MFLRRSDPFDLPSVSHEINVLIQKGCRLEGRLEFEGTGRVDGDFKGEVFTPDIFVIGDGATVTGRIEADIVVISGRFEGEILATRRVELHSPAIVRGTIQSAVLQIEEGAVFDGNTRMIS